MATDFGDAIARRAAVGHGHEKLDEHGNLIDGTVRQELRDSVSTLVALTLESVAAAA